MMRLKSQKKQEQEDNGEKGNRPIIPCYYVVKQEEFVLTLGGQRSNERITRWKTTCNGKKKNEKRKRKRRAMFQQ